MMVYAASCYLLSLMKYAFGKWLQSEETFRFLTDFQSSIKMVVEQSLYY